jgi:hypothetical protein
VIGKGELGEKVERRVARDGCDDGDKSVNCESCVWFLRLTATDVMRVHLS